MGILWSLPKSYKLKIRVREWFSAPELQDWESALKCHNIQNLLSTGSPPKHIQELLNDNILKHMSCISHIINNIKYTTSTYGRPDFQKIIMKIKIWDGILDVAQGLDVHEKWIISWGGNTLMKSDGYSDFIVICNGEILNDFRIKSELTQTNQLGQYILS